MAETGTAHSSTADSGSQASSSTGPRESSPTELMGEFLSHLATYLHSQWDLACLSLWSLAIRLVFFVSVAVLLVAASITVGILAIHYVMSGLAGGIAQLVDGPEWVGRLATGLLVLVGFGVTVGGVIWKYQSTSSDELRIKYQEQHGSKEDDIG